MTNKKNRTIHTAEFKAEVLKLAEEVGIASAAKQQSLHESQVYAWQKAVNKNSNTSQQKAELEAERLETPKTRYLKVKDAIKNSKGRDGSDVFKSS